MKPSSRSWPARTTLLSPSCTTVSGASPTASRYAFFETRSSPRTPSRRVSWRPGAAPTASCGRAGTWVLTLVHRRAVDLVRREDRRRAEALTDDVEPVASSSAEDDAWLRFERERVQAALRQLPDQQREALELAYYGGFSQSELAERLGQPVGTIKSRMFAGLARLRELLADPGAGEMAWKPTPSTT